MPQNDVIPVFVYREIFDDFIYIGIGITFQAVIDVVFVAGRPFGGNGISSRKILSGSIDFCRSFAYNSIGVKIFKVVGQLEPGDFENFLAPFFIPIKQPNRNRYNFSGGY